ncbi:hypothetical protein CP973_08010 [Streptomyces albofaciens JCM 4342]|uniref:hypothetical protein n=1 Tax=Streptomyces albofaciens TaxID=66866 RepID=UPI00123C1955|nr:hypothetical protein [Streptomyces albofaciens]KAA6221909.1 hypothetical protein CP973_08010 [Streptomyces albofaciens JCM 4342]
MLAHLADTARQLAAVLWQQHTVYRDRTGGVVIRGEHVERWISLSATGTRGEVLIRAGRILDGGTSAPARAETVMRLDSGTGELAAACRRLLADIAMSAEPAASRAPGYARPARQARPRPRKARVALWVVLATVTSASVVALLVAYSSYSAASGR